MLAQRKKLNDQGQAVIEMALAMPFLIWLIYYTLNAFYMIHTSHIAQKYSAMSLYQRLNNRSKIVVDDVERQVVNSQALAVKYKDPNTQNSPERKIISKTKRLMNNVVGICRDPECN